MTVKEVSKISCHALLFLTYPSCHYVLPYPNIERQMALLMLTHAKNEVKTLKRQNLCWDKLPSACCSLSLSNQNPQSSVCCFLFSLLLVRCTHWREPTSTQLSLVGESEQVAKRGKTMEQHWQGFLTHSKTKDSTELMIILKQMGYKHTYPFSNFIILACQVGLQKSKLMKQNLEIW